MPPSPPSSSSSPTVLTPASDDSPNFQSGSSTTSHRTTSTSSASHPDFRVVRKRNRIPLSCGPCRNRKLKCNRVSPCDNCTRRKDTDSCTYAVTTTSRARPRERGGSSDEMQSRIDRLEGLVLSLMNGGAGPGGDNLSERSESVSTGGGKEGMGRMGEEEAGCDMDRMDDEDVGMKSVRTAFGVMKFDGDKSYYRGETHWAAILQEISGMRTAFDEAKTNHQSEKPPAPGDSAPAPLPPPKPPGLTGFPLSPHGAISREELVAMVPQRELVDLLIDAYFRNFDPLFHFIHRPTFTAQYTRFWHDPSSADMPWLALLFSMLACILRIYHYSGEEPSSLSGQTLSMSATLRTAAETCLATSEFIKQPYMHTIQALILLCIFPKGNDKADYLWPILGLTIRVAMAMGLHREISAIPDPINITPKTSEIRRRLWAQLMCLELTYSIQMGLPSMIREGEWDANLPTNIPDDDLDLPPNQLRTLRPRPKSEMTEVSYLVNYLRLMSFYTTTARAISSSGSRFTFTSQRRFLASAISSYSAVPEFLKLPSGASMKTMLAANEPLWLILQRYMLSIIHQKALLIIHQPFTYRCSKNPHWRENRRGCVNAAMRLLQYHAELTDDSSDRSRWFITAQRILNEFLLSAMIVCLHLSTTAAEAQNPPPPSNDALPDEPPFGDDSDYPRGAYYSALEGFQKVLKRYEFTDYESAKVVGILNLIFARLQNEDPDFPHSSEPLAAAAAAHRTNPNHGVSCEPPTNSAELKRPDPPTQSVPQQAELNNPLSPGTVLDIFLHPAAFASPPPSGAGEGVLSQEQLEADMNGWLSWGSIGPGWGGPFGGGPSNIWGEDGTWAGDEAMAGGIEASGDVIGDQAVLGWGGGGGYGFYGSERGGGNHHEALGRFEQFQAKDGEGK